MNKKTAAPSKATAFTKEQLLHSQRYAADRDLVAALLQDGAAYTIGKTDAIIQKYKKGQVT